MFKYRSCGKINSFLNVLSEMPNGYHKINTHYQLIDIFDDIEFTENDVDKIESNAKLDFESNSIKRAINWFNKKFNKDQGFRIKLTKNIPIGAGLGGGSSNCATTLKFLLKKLLIFRQIHKIIFLQDCMFEEMYLNLHSLIK